MLTLNSISISASESVLDEIYRKMSANSVESNIANYHSHSSNKSEFVSIFLQEETLDSLEFEWAYIESCERKEGLVSAVAYSWKGNLSTWTAKMASLYSEDPEFDISLETIKSVKLKNYEIEKDWEEVAVAKDPIIYKKGTK